MEERVESDWLVGEAFSLPGENWPAWAEAGWGDAAQATAPGKRPGTASSEAAISMSSDAYRFSK